MTTPSRAERPRAVAAALGLGLGLAAAVGLAVAPSPAAAAPVVFTELTGTTGGSPAATGVFRADLSGLGLGQIASLTIADNSGGLGGSPGAFSGFDLDAVVISTVLIGDASLVGTLTRAATLDLAGAVFAAGAQRPPLAPALFGTAGGAVDGAAATLDAFDGNSTTAIPGAAGFVSLGDGGVLSVNLTSAIPVSSPLYLYIGEVGNNGEVAASSVTVSSTPVPEPAALAVFGAGLAALGLARRRRAAAAPG